MHSYKNLAQVRYVVAVGAGKGGVGKSSICVGIALALSKAGYAVGILDADIYGPSLRQMLPVKQPFLTGERGEITPGLSHGVKVFSLGYGKERAALVRAPIANSLIIECLEDVIWGELDYLFLDCPPGTGDILFTLFQEVELSGCILVTTPQEVAVLDVKKMVHMCHQMHVPILGVVENMAYFIDPKTKERHAIFGEGGAKSLSDTFGFPILGQIPLDSTFCFCSDKGENIVNYAPESQVTRNLEELSIKVRSALFARETQGRKSFEITWKEME